MSKYMMLYFNSSSNTLNLSHYFCECMQVYHHLHTFSISITSIDDPDDPELSGLVINEGKTKIFRIGTKHDDIMPITNKVKFEYAKTFKLLRQHA